MRDPMRLPGLIFGAVLLSLTCAQAGEVVESDGELSLDDFYRAIACGADAGGGACRTEIVKWPKATRKHLKVYFRKPQDGFPEDRIKMSMAAVRLAMREVNVSGAGVQLEDSDDPSAPIQISLLNASWGDWVDDTGDPVLDKHRMRATLSAIHLKPGTQDIEKASLAISAHINPDIIRAAALKELMSVLGLEVRIDNPFYMDKSVFTEMGYRVQLLRLQDMLSLRLHYPGT